MQYYKELARRLHTLQSKNEKEALEKVPFLIHYFQILTKYSK